MILKTAYYPVENEWDSFCKRPAFDTDDLDKLIEDIFTAVQLKGDEALTYYSGIFDKRETDVFLLEEASIRSAGHGLEPALRAAINLAAENIRKFHSYIFSVERSPIETSAGVRCWQKRLPLQRVGLYVPAGTAPLFSTVLMLAIPAVIAGCKEIVLCCPPDQHGKVNEAVLYAAKVAGVREIYTIGGAQAIAAMAIGTKSIKKVDKIFGPGNQYVTAAKQYTARHFCPIDLPAGPSEVLVLADHSANPVYVAADLLAQAEHGVDSQVLLVSTSSELIEAVNQELLVQLKSLPRAEIAAAALANSHAVVFKDVGKGIQFSNQYAPEHLIIASQDAEVLAQQVVNAGSVFVGHLTPESAGDYASGTNHTLPTNGFARSLSGLTTDAFTKTISFQQIDENGLHNLGPAIEIMAKAENLLAHSRAVTYRLKNLEHDKSI